MGQGVEPQGRGTGEKSEGGEMLVASTVMLMVTTVGV